MALAAMVTWGNTAVCQERPKPPAPPKVFLETSVASTPVTGKTIEVAAGGDFQAALDKAQPGDEIVLQAGSTYTGNFILPAKEHGEKWITVRTSNMATLPKEDTRVSPKDAAAMPKIVTLAYRADGSLETIERYRTNAPTTCRLVTSYEYWDDGRLFYLEDREAGTPPAADPIRLFSFRYDAKGRLKSLVSKTNATYDSPPESPYDYDATDQLLAAGYTFDANGNRKGQGYGNGPYNRVTYYSDGPGATLYHVSYDDEGNWKGEDTWEIRATASRDEEVADDDDTPYFDWQFTQQLLYVGDKWMISVTWTTAANAVQNVAFRPPERHDRGGIA